jgi:ribonuclease HII
MPDFGALYLFDRACPAGRAGRLAGVDEAGRGPLAGPVVAAAVCLRLDSPIDGLNDSKKLSAAKRDSLYERIVTESTAWAVGMASVEEIARLNILQASLLAMTRALDGLAMTWDMAWVDGNQPIPSVPRDRQETLVSGDARSASVAAASVVAKVHRDRLMAELAKEYPGYGFEQHKGYATAVHIDRIRTLGLCPAHRRSFCENLVAQTFLVFD